MSSSAKTSVLMSLSLFIILLAFFIVLNAVSNYSEEKTEKVFDSIDLAFATELIPSTQDNKIMDQSQIQNDGKGDSIENVQDTLRSILPGLDMDLTDDPNGGKVMAIRIKKDQFNNLSSRLIPVLVRIMTIKDGTQSFKMTMTSFVRSPLSRGANTSYRIIDQYRDDFIAKGVNGSRITLALEQGNPAFLMFRFDGAR